MCVQKIYIFVACFQKRMLDIFCSNFWWHFGFPWSFFNPSDLYIVFVWLFCPFGFESVEEKIFFSHIFKEMLVFFLNYFLLPVTYALSYVVKINNLSFLTLIGWLS